MHLLLQMLPKEMIIDIYLFVSFLCQISFPFIFYITGGMYFLMYTSGAEEKLECLQRTSCEEPYLAGKYLTAAKMWYKMHKYLKS